MSTLLTAGSVRWRMRTAPVVCAPEGGVVTQTLVDPNFTSGGAYARTTACRRDAGRDRGVSHARPAILQSENSWPGILQAENFDEGIATHGMGVSVCAKAILPFRFVDHVNHCFLADEVNGITVTRDAEAVACDRPDLILRAPDTYPITHLYSHFSRALRHRRHRT